jgi:DNA-binding PadR family transcriptional regulator
MILYRYWIILNHTPEGPLAMPDVTRAPLKPALFHILLALADGAQHGFAIREIVEERTDGAVRLWPATLYGSIREMTGAGWIEPLEGEDDPDDDQRRRYYRLSPLGRDVLRAETDRLQALVDVARASRALGTA